MSPTIYSDSCDSCQAKTFHHEQLISLTKWYDESSRGRIAYVAMARCRKHVIGLKICLNQSGGRKCTDGCF